MLCSRLRCSAGSLISRSVIPKPPLSLGRVTVVRFIGSVLSDHRNLKISLFIERERGWINP